MLQLWSSRGWGLSMVEAFEERGVGTWAGGICCFWHAIWREAGGTRVGTGQDERAVALASAVHSVLSGVCCELRARDGPVGGAVSTLPGLCFIASGGTSWASFAWCLL